MNYDVIIIVPGETHEGHDPGLTAKGREQVAELAKFLPPDYDPDMDFVYAGTATSHKQVAEILNLKIDITNIEFGQGDNLEIQRDGSKIMVTYGGKVPLEQYQFLSHSNAVQVLTDNLEEGDTLIASREFMHALSLGRAQVASGGVWKATIRDDSLSELAQLKNNHTA